jgi:RNase adaptor protein for sRNA GlmZ degradation
MEDIAKPVDAVSSPESNSKFDCRHNLVLISYGHTNGPLETPRCRQLTFSVRNLPNPPVALRKSHTGLSARLRKEVLATSEATLRLAEMEAAIIEAMAQCEQKSSSSHNAGVTEQDDEPDEHSMNLQVGVFCEEGKHRSVSIVHELARSTALKRPGWSISEHHRDAGREIHSSQKASSTPSKSRTGRTVKRKPDSRRSGAFPGDDFD